MREVTDQQVTEIISYEMAKELILAKFTAVDEALLEKILSNDKNHDEPFRRAIDASIIYEIVKIADEKNGH